MLGSRSLLGGYIGKKVSVWLVLGMSHLTAANAIAALAANGVFAGNPALPAKSAFSRRQRLRWGVVGGLRGGEGAGLQYCYRNPTANS